MFRELLPRHIEIIYEINARFLDQVRMRYPMDNKRIASLSLIDESGEKYVRMANLACVGSHGINGVSRLHTRLLEDIVLKDCHEYWPDKIINITNG
ncbi:MAG TPA: glycogen phosphorylase, partial [Campylobacterales bacterium]|nr:glycogen phosphorylase [Campylobacterales bacterium]